MNHRSYLHSRNRSPNGCGFNTVVEERVRARFLARVEKAAKDGVECLVVCDHCFEARAATEFVWPDGTVVGDVVRGRAGKGGG